MHVSWRCEKWTNKPQASNCTACSGLHGLQREKQWGRVREAWARRTRVAKYACYQVKLKGFSRACWADLIQLRGDALCYVPCYPVGGVDPPSCMFPSMIINLKSHPSGQLEAPVLPFIVWDFRAVAPAVWLTYRLKKRKRGKVYSVDAGNYHLDHFLFDYVGLEFRKVHFKDHSTPGQLEWKENLVKRHGNEKEKWGTQ